MDEKNAAADGKKAGVIDIDLYALNLKEDGRILSATADQYGAPGQPRVETLPEGDISDYRYEGGEYVYDPLPALGPPAEVPTVEADIQGLVVDHEYRLTLLELGITE